MFPAPLVRHAAGVEASRPTTAGPAGVRGVALPAPVAPSQPRGVGPGGGGSRRRIRDLWFFLDIMVPTESQGPFLLDRLREEEEPDLASVTVVGKPSRAVGSRRPFPGRVREVPTVVRLGKPSLLVCDFRLERR